MRAGALQRTNDRRAAAAGGLHQRSQAVSVGNVGIGALREKHVNCLLLTIPCREEQGGGAGVVSRVDVCVRVERGLQFVQVACPRRLEECCR